MASARITLEQTPPSWCRQGAVTIGNFDGAHRGHQALLQELRRQAAAVGGPAVVLTFDPHPLQILRPERFQPLLTTVADRLELLEAQGADVIVLETTPALLQLTAAAFFGQVIRERFQARAVVEGPNFGFGHNREGTIQTLEKLCRESGLALTVVSPLEQEGVVISSSRVRQALVRGAVAEATGMLGRPYRLRGTVGTGQRRGKTLGFPTANVDKVSTIIPGDGVYAVRAHTEGAQPKGDGNWPGAANIGPNPTFGEQARKVEVHLIGFQGDLYGQPLAVDFIDRLRDTRPFPSVAELVKQLQEDVEQARRLVARNASRTS
jgi:riboflavin kinase/FMN adenylyltransferase